jgi:hypothetical protein
LARIIWINRIGNLRASMSYEIECPVCDRKAPSSATVCQYCGADLKMASFDELEEVAQAVAVGKASSKPEPRPAPKPSEAKSEPTPKEATVQEAEPPKEPTKQHTAPIEEKAQESAEKAKEEKKEDEGKRGLGRLFGKKKK